MGRQESGQCADGASVRRNEVAHGARAEPLAHVGAAAQATLSASPEVLALVPRHGRTYDDAVQRAKKAAFAIAVRRHAGAAQCETEGRELRGPCLKLEQHRPWRKRGDRGMMARRRSHQADGTLFRCIENNVMIRARSTPDTRRIFRNRHREATVLEPTLARPRTTQHNPGGMDGCL